MQIKYSNTLFSKYTDTAFSLLSLDKQRAAVSFMGVIVVEIFLPLCMVVTAYS